MMDTHGADFTEPALALVGELLLAEPDAARDVFRIVRPSDIPGADLRAVYVAAQDVLERDGVIDVVLVRAELVARNGMTSQDRSVLLARVMGAAVTTANLRLHAQIVASNAARAEQSDAAQALAAANDDAGRHAAQRNLEAAAKRLQQVADWEDAAEGPKPLDL